MSISKRSRVFAKANLVSVKPEIIVAGFTGGLVQTVVASSHRTGRTVGLVE